MPRNSPRSSKPTAPATPTPPSPPVTAAAVRAFPTSSPAASPHTSAPRSPHPAGAAVASICKTLASVSHSSRTRRLSVAQTLAIYAVYRAEIDAVLARRTRTIGLRSIGVSAAFAFAVAGLGGTALPASLRLLRILEQLNSGEDLVLADPISKLRVFLTSQQAKLLTRGTDYALTLLVLDAIHKRLSHIAGDLAVVPDGFDYFAALQPKRIAALSQILDLPDPKS